jgi:predicted GH43/DUF377 family glycosyl hydrolase
LFSPTQVTDLGRELQLLRLTRYHGNPIITPEHGQPWETGGTFNPAAVDADGATHLLYRAVDTNRISRLGYARTFDGTQIVSRSANPVLEPSAEWEEFGCEDPRITQIDGTFHVTYTAYSHRGTRVALASTEDFQHFKKHGIVGPDRNDKDCVLFPERINGKMALLHRIKSKIQIAYFDSFDELEDSHKFWDDYLKHFQDFEIIRPKFLWERRKVGTGPPPIKLDSGWLVLYHGVSIERIYRTGALLLDLDEPKKIIARTETPILEPEMEFERKGVVPNVVFPDGAVIHGGELLVYYGGADRVCCVASAPLDEFLDELKKETPPT